MSAFAAFLEGFRRASRAPGLIMAIWAANLAVAAPLGVLMLAAIQDFTAKSDYQEALLGGFDTGWHAEFTGAGGAVEKTLTPSHVGVGAWLANLDRWWDGRVFLEHPAILAPAAVFVLCWLLLLGGVLESVREGAPRPRLTTVLSDGYAFFGRFLRVTVLAGLAYYSIFRFARWLFPKVHRATIDWTVEKDVLMLNLVVAFGIVALITIVRLVSDYAKIAIVVERKKSALLAGVRGLRFVIRHPVRVLAVAGLYGLAMGVVFIVYSVVAPGAGDSSPVAIVLAFALSQLFLIAKQAMRISFLGSEMALFEIHR